MELTSCIDDCTYIPLRPGVLEAVHIAAQVGANPSSLHSLGRHARRTMQRVSHEVLDFAGAALNDQVVYTGGSLEANLLAILGAVTPPKTVLWVETEALRALCTPWLAERGIPSHEASYNTLAEHLTDNVGLVVMGLTQGPSLKTAPIHEAALLCRARGIDVHVDVGSAAGRLPLEFARWACASMTLDPRTFGGPQGLGVLVVRRKHTLTPLWLGGGQQQGMRSGTPPWPLVVGLGVAVQYAKSVSFRGKQCVL